MEKQELNNLIMLAQQGDLSAFELVVAQYRPIAKAIAHTFNVEDVDFEDLVQAGMIGLFCAVQTFKEDAGAGFNTYASACIRNRMLDELNKNKPSSLEIVDIDDVAESIPSTDADPETSYIQGESTSALLGTIHDTLSPFENDVFMLYIQKFSYEEIAQKLGTERKKVDNTIYATKKKLQKVLEKLEL